MQYIARPIQVDAFEISSIVGPIVELSNKQVRIVTPEMSSRYTPVVGDYWVIQDDGYEYVNPKHVFERKYARVMGGQGAIGSKQAEAQTETLSLSKDKDTNISDR